MKFLFTVVLLSFSGSLFSASTCKQLEKNLNSDLRALGGMMSSGPKKIRTQSDSPEAMLHEYLKSEYPDDDHSEYTVRLQQEKMPEWGELEVGTTTKKEGMDSIMGMAETYYISDDTTGIDSPQKRAKIEALAKKAIKNPVLMGYDVSAQGWGGSPATNLLFMVPRCNFLMVFFLGITEG